MCIVVTPPASASSNCGSCGQMACSDETSAGFGLVISLPSCSDSIPRAAQTPRCECVSMTPGVTHLPDASITTASEGAVTVAPTAATLPFCNRISPRSLAGPAAVRIVALRITVVRAVPGLYVDPYGLAGACWPAATAVDARMTATRIARMTRRIIQAQEQAAGGRQEAGGRRRQEGAGGGSR